MRRAIAPSPSREYVQMQGRRSVQTKSDGALGRYSTKRPYTPTAPKSAPTKPAAKAGKKPVGSVGTTPLNEMKLVVAAASLANEPPVPPPVKFAPLGYKEKRQTLISTRVQIIAGGRIEKGQGIAKGGMCGSGEMLRPSHLPR